jgi:hypothetical protein
MPTTNRPRPNETREMRLFSKVIELRGALLNERTGAEGLSTSLPQFIARRRTPGESWRSWDEIRYELTDLSGEIVSDGTIRKWAQRYGIPETTQADGKGETTARAYAVALRKAGIDL